MNHDAYHMQHMLCKLLIDLETVNREFVSGDWKLERVRILGQHALSNIFRHRYSQIDSIQPLSTGRSL